jgi:hypothetical protein
MLAPGKRLLFLTLWAHPTVVLIATTFTGTYTPGTDTAWGIGGGQWTVNYQQVSTTFWPLTKFYAPVAVLTFSRWLGTNEWVFETVARNDIQADWDNQPPYEYAGTPYAGGDPNDPAHLNGGPNSNGGSVTDNPPDRNYPAYSGTDTANNVRPMSSMSDTLMAIVTRNILAANIGVSPVQGDTAGTLGGNNFVSAFVAYHAIWYQSFAFQSCQIGFHTHVGYSLTLAQCQEALCIQLQAAINLLGGSVTQPCS